MLTEDFSWMTERRDEQMNCSERPPGLLWASQILPTDADSFGRCVNSTWPGQHDCSNDRRPYRDRVPSPLWDVLSFTAHAEHTPEIPPWSLVEFVFRITWQALEAIDFRANTKESLCSLSLIWWRSKRKTKCKSIYCFIENFVLIIQEGTTLAHDPVFVSLYLIKLRGVA